MLNTENITINTHSSIRIEGSQVLYFDPFEVAQESHDADVIFVTHEHYDHFQPESMEKVKTEHTILVAPESMREKVLAQSGVPEENCRFCRPGIPGTDGGSLQPGAVPDLGKIVARAVPSYNLGKPFHPKENNWVGYVVQMDGISYYVAGDTDLNNDIKEVTCDIALIPVGGHYTMNVEESAQLVSTIKPKIAIPTHYGSVVGDLSMGQTFAELVRKRDPQIEVNLKIQP